jgi:hypothetical protein
MLCYSPVAILRALTGPARRHVLGKHVLGRAAMSLVGEAKLHL